MTPRTKSSSDQLADYRWLVGGEADHIMKDLAQSPRENSDYAKLLRKTLSASRVHLILEQIELRRRAKSKFVSADRTFFTPLGLEQATDQWVAAYKARRFQAIAAPVLDLCCGIGGDLMALAQQGTAVGVDCDRVTAFLARANVPTSADIVVANAEDFAGANASWHMDPDRRPSGRRTTRIDFYEPSSIVIEKLLASAEAAAIKLAPAMEVPERWKREAELEWISRAGQCRQLVAWFGRVATTPGHRRATVLFGQDPQSPYRSLTGEQGAATAIAANFGRYLAEPDAAILAADLVSVLAKEHGLAAIAPGAVYLTGDRATADPALAWFEITEVLPFDVRRVKSLLRERGIGRPEIKKRGVDIEPEQLRRQLRVPGDEVATLFLARRGSSVTALLSRRVSP